MSIWKWSFSNPAATGSCIDGKALLSVGNLDLLADALSASFLYILQAPKFRHTNRYSHRFPTNQDEQL